MEYKLLLLGRQELLLETQMKLLKKKTRELGDAGRFDDADMAWEMYEEARRQLGPLQSEIAQVERVLYTLRRRPRK